MILILQWIKAAVVLVCFSDSVKSFGLTRNALRERSSSTTSLLLSETSLESSSATEVSIWENIANRIYPSSDLSNDYEESKAYTNAVSLLRVGIPSLFLASSAKISYPFVAIALANAIDDSGVFAVVSQDASQYIQNICTTSGLTFSILVGQTYYFMYQVRKQNRNKRNTESCKRYLLSSRKQINCNETGKLKWK